MMTIDAHQPAQVRHRVLVAVADGRDRDDQVPQRVRGGLDVRAFDRLLDGEDGHAAEFDDDDRQQQDEQQDRPGPVVEQSSTSSSALARARKPSNDGHDSDEPDDPQAGNAREQVEPAVAASQVRAPFSGNRQASRRSRSRTRASRRYPSTATTWATASLRTSANRNRLSSEIRAMPRTKSSQAIASRTAPEASW